MKKTFTSLAQHRAKNLREQARKQQPSIQALADRYGISVSMVSKILRGTRCCDSDAEPIYLASNRKLKRAAVVALLRRLAVKYAEIAEFLGVSKTTVLDAARIDAPIDAEVHVELIEQAQTVEGKRIQTGKYRLVSSGDDVMLTREDESPVFANIEELIGRIKLCPKANE